MYGIKKTDIGFDEMQPWNDEGNKPCLLHISYIRRYGYGGEDSDYTERHHQFSHTHAPLAVCQPEDMPVNHDLLIDRLKFIQNKRLLG